MLKVAIKKAFQTIGLDIYRYKNSPKQTLLSLHKAPLRTIIDIGANTGQFAIWMRKVFPNIKIYCFEPLPDPFRKLNDWANSQQDGNVTTFQVALSDREGVSQIFYHTDHSASSSLLMTTNTTDTLYPFTQKQIPLQVATKKLDSIFDDSNIQLIPEILIKLDVQGFEDRVIRGGEKTFSRATACIVEINIEVLYEKQADFMDIISLLHPLGYRYAGNIDQIYGKNGNVIFIDAVFIRDIDKRKENI